MQNRCKLFNSEFRILNSELMLALYKCFLIFRLFIKKIKPIKYMGLIFYLEIIVFCLYFDIV